MNRIKIVGDIGGTNARFACVTDAGNFYHKLKVYPCAEFPSFEDAIQSYIAYLKKLSDIPEFSLEDICLAFAGPIYHDIIDLPNNHWSFSRTKLQRILGVPVKIINDFTAQTLCLDLLAEDELQWFDEMRPKGNDTRVVIGPGTGLGVSIQMGNGEIIPSEAGHVAFAPRSPHHLDILKLLWTRHERVSIERILSGQGLENLYWANSCIAGKEGNQEAPKILELAKQGDEIANNAITDFFQILACFSGDIAMIAWASDGVFLSGGILPKLWDLFDMQKFRQQFQDKGRFSSFCKSVPIAMVKAEQPGLLGCVAALHNSI